MLALPSGAAWVAEFDSFLAAYGQRTEETCRIDTPSWIEDPSPALYSIGTFLTKPAGFDFHAARAAAVAERDAQIDQARRSLNGSDLTRFNEALASNQAANFAWWNEEHNYLIDRRAAIPVRRATLELGARLTDAGRISRPDDMFYLFKPELFEVMESGGRAAGWAELAAMIPDRRAYFEHWRERGPSLPTMLGTIPDTVPDPIMIEVFGLSGHFLETLRGRAAAAPGGGAEIRGFPAAKGVAEGVARVITTVTDLHTVQPGEILVCGGTTTEWTPAFGIILGVRVRHRRLADARGDRQPRVRHPLRGRHRGGHHHDQDRRSGPGRRPGGNGPGPRVSSLPLAAGEAVVDLAVIRASDAPRVGPKMARLGQLASTGWRVPDGYAITAAALEGWLPPAALAELHRLFSAPVSAGARRRGGRGRPGPMRRTPAAGPAVGAGAAADRGPVAAVVAGGRGRGRACAAGGSHRAGGGAAGRGPVVGGGRGRALGQLRRAVRDLPGRVRHRRGAPPHREVLGQRVLGARARLPPPVRRVEPAARP